MELVGKNKNWRVAAFIIAVVYIAYMWIHKDIASAFTEMPKGEALPIVAVTIAVTLLKVIAFAGVLLLIKWATKKIFTKE